MVTPTEGTVYAPADGEVEFIFDTKHAIGFQTDSGIPMLLHMGIDTVKLEGKGFEILVTEGQKVKKGDPMMKLDLEFLTANAPSITSPILDTEPEDNQRIRLLANGEIKAGEPNGKKIAVVGGGPAGIAAAYFLAREGAAVTIFEKKRKPAA